MADPRPLFYIAAVVIVGLVVWVASVLLRSGEKWAKPEPETGPSKEPAPDAPRPPA